MEEMHRQTDEFTQDTNYTSNKFFTTNGGEKNGRGHMTKTFLLCALYTNERAFLLHQLSNKKEKFSHGKLK
jgi:hypothetical protein